MKASFALLALVFLLPATTASAQVDVRLHPDLPDVLDRAWLDRLAVFPDASSVRFVRTAWGGIVAVLDETRQRALPDSEWNALRAQAAAVVAGEAVPPPSPSPSPAKVGSLCAWPEVPLSETAILAPPRLAPAGYPALAGHWQAVLEAGVRSNVTSFDEFFTPMGTIGVGFGYPFADRVAALLNFSAGFGDMRGDFEESFGDGRANTFAFSLGLLLRQPVSRRASLYVEADGGYYIRSLMWGGAFNDAVTGEVTDGLVLEQQNWGGGLRAGVLLQRKHPDKPRFLDIGVGLQTTPADRWDFWTEERRFTADERDTWVSLTVRFWDAI
jgi:hypothetical protein